MTERVLDVPKDLLQKYYDGLGEDTFAGVTRSMSLPIPVIRSMLAELLEIREAIHKAGDKPEYETKELEHAYLIGFYEGNGFGRREMKRRGIE